MPISCNIVRNPLNESEILFTEAPNGARSELYDGLKERVDTQDEALALWLTSKTKKFRDTAVTPKLNQHRVQITSRLDNISPKADIISIVDPERGPLKLDLQNITFVKETPPNMVPMIGPRKYPTTIDEQMALVELQYDAAGNILAPNGKISNLSEKHARLVRTQSFKDWFGDWINDPRNSSQVVDENGEPQILYHGSPVPNLENFNRALSGRRDSGLKEYGTYFTTNKKIAQLYSETPRSKELEADIQEKIDNYYKALKNVRNTRDYDMINREIEKLESGAVYEVFLNLRDIHQFDAQGEGGVRAYDNLQVQADYKVAQNRDAMEFLKEGRFGVPKKQAIKALNVAEVDSLYYQNMTPQERESLLGTTYLVFDGQEANMKMATTTGFGPANTTTRMVQGPSIMETITAYANPIEGDDKSVVKLGRIRYAIRGNEIMIDNTTLSDLLVQDTQVLAPAGQRFDINLVRSQVRAGLKVAKSMGVRKGVFTEYDLTRDRFRELAKKDSQAKKGYINNANLIREFAQVRGMKYFKKATTIAQADRIHEAYISMMVDNLKFLHDQYDDKFVGPATLWYDGANKIAKDYAKQFGVTTEQVAGVIASLSPQNDWYQNVRVAELTLKVAKIDPEVNETMIQTHAEYSARMEGGKKTKQDKDKAKAKNDNTRERLKTYLGMKMSEIPIEDQGHVVRMYSEAYESRQYNVLRPDGQVLGIAVNKDKDQTPSSYAWGSNSEIVKAISIIRDGSSQNISRQLGLAHKIRNFYNNIIDPMSSDGDVTMDTHATAAAYLEPLSGNSKKVIQNFGGQGAYMSSVNGISGLYYAIQEAYQIAAKDLGLLPRQLQSITWEAVRGLFPDSYKTKENSKKIEAIWNQYRRGDLTIEETRKSILNAAKGIDDPTWARFNLSRHDKAVGQGAQQGGVRDGNDGGLRASDVPGGPATPGESVSRSGGLRGLGIGSALYGNLFTRAMERGLNVVSSDNLSPAATAMWEKLVSRGVARQIGDRYMLAQYPAGFDPNGEPSVDMVIDFSDRQAYLSEMTPEEEIELYDIMMGLPVEDSESLLLALKRGFMPEGSFKPTRESLAMTGLYTSENITDLLTDEETLEQVREFIYKLEKLDGVYSNDMYTDETYSVIDDGSKTKIGTYKLRNPFEVEQQVIEKLGGFETREQFEEALYTDDVQEMVAATYEAFKNSPSDLFHRLRNFKPSAQAAIIDGVLTPRLTGVGEKIVQTIMEPISRTLEKHADLLASTPEETWISQPEVPQQLLTSVQNELRAIGLDIEQLPQVAKLNAVDDVKSFLRAVTKYAREQTKPNVEALISEYEMLYDIKSKFMYKKRALPATVKSAANLFTVNTTTTGVGIFLDHQLLPIGENLYKRVDTASVDTMLNTIYDHLLANNGYGGVLPTEALLPAAADTDGTINMAKVQDRENRVDIINSMRQWAEVEAGKLYVGDRKPRMETLQAYVLMFHFYNKSGDYTKFDTKVPMSEDYHLMANPVADLPDLTGPFVGRFNLKMIKAKKANNAEWKNFYSNFDINEEGIVLKNDNPISRNKIKPYLQTNQRLVEYFRVHKNKPELAPEQLEEAVRDDLFMRNYYTNYPTALQPFSGDFTTIDGNTIAATSKKPFIRLRDGVYEFVEGVGKFGIYVKHKVNETPLKRYDPALKPPTMEANRAKLKNMTNTVQDVFEIKHLYDMDERFDIDNNYDFC
jgi:hypothetical protein